MKKVFLCLVFAWGTALLARELLLTPAPARFEWGDEETVLAPADWLNVEIDPTDDPVLPPEGYKLTVTGTGASVSGADAAGRYYALVTLENLRTLYPDGIPAVTIIDFPSVAYRGIMVDVARHFIPMENLEKFIDMMARYKFNYLQLHLSDDQGWRIEIKKYPKLTEVGAVRGPSEIWPQDGKKYGPYFYTQDQMRALIKYAAERSITIVPEIDLPGHSLAALSSYPELGCTGGPYKPMTRWGISKDVLCAGNPFTREFVSDVVAELAGLFPGPYIHLGGDECPLTRWEDCPRCQMAVAELGLSGVEQLEDRLLADFSGYVEKNGKRMIGWDEMLTGEIPGDAVIMAWRGNYGARNAARRAHDVVVASYSHCYFDYAQTSSHKEEEWCAAPVCTDLRRVYSFSTDLLPGDPAAKHIVGAQAELWSEGIFTPADLEYKACPRMIALSEALWSPKSARDFQSFARRVAGEMRFLRGNGVSARFAPATLPATVYFSDEFVYDIGQLPDGVDILYTLDGSRPSASQSAARYSEKRPRVTADADLVLEYEFSGLPAPQRPFPATRSALRKAVPVPAVKDVSARPGFWFDYRVGQVRGGMMRTNLDFDPEPSLFRSGGGWSGSVEGYFLAPETANYEFSIACCGTVTIALKGAEPFTYTGDGVFHSIEKSYLLEKGYHPVRIDFSLAAPGGHHNGMQLYVARGLGRQLPLAQFLFHGGENNAK
ncbi:MAG: family 20 glycosylhydrolase [Victivallaceae bacterium]|nr:family 20 glycosylhydrolase [Victivallaceae bacterium]